MGKANLAVQTLLADTQSLVQPAHKKGGWRRWLARRWQWVVMLGMIIVGVSTLAVLLRIEPEFYAQRPRLADRDQERQLAVRFVNQALRLVSDLKDSRDVWQAKFEEKSLNAWLARDLSGDSPTQPLPEGISDPRIAMEDNKLRVGFRFEWNHLRTVIHLELKTWVPKQNLLIVELEGAHAGLVPLPTNFVQRIMEESAHHYNLEIRWKRNQKNIVALIHFPQRNILLHKVTITNNGLIVRGRGKRLTVPNMKNSKGTPHHAAKKPMENPMEKPIKENPETLPAQPTQPVDGDDEKVPNPVLPTNGEK